MVYELIDEKSGQHAKGTAVDLSKLTGVSMEQICCLAREGGVYKKRYRVQKLQEEVANTINTATKLCQKWDEIHQIALDLKEGKRRIQKAADGKWYAVKI